MPEVRLANEIEDVPRFIIFGNSISAPPGPDQQYDKLLCYGVMKERMTLVGTNPLLCSATVSSNDTLVVDIHCFYI